MATVQLDILGSNLPGRCFGPHDNVHIGVQCKTEVVEWVAGDESRARWTLDIEVRAEDFHGPYVHGTRGQASCI